MSGKLLDRLATQYTESQSWNKLLNLMNACEYRNCDPSQKTASYIKKNLVYCFDTGVRSQLKESVEQFDAKFFSNVGREKHRLYVNAQKQDKIKEESTKAVEEVISTPVETQQQQAAQM